MKKLTGIFLLLLLAASSAQAENSPASANYAYIDVLYWQMREITAENWAQIFTAPGTQTSRRIIGAPFDWNAGVRLGIGHAFHQGSFDLTLIYTHYNATANSSAAGIVTSAFDGNYFANNTNGGKFGPSYDSANLRWLFFYNTWDVELGRTIQISNALQVHPYLGLKVASINQNIYSNWLNPSSPTNYTSATENLVWKFLAIGPMLGVDSAWPVYQVNQQSFNLIGNLGAGLLWGHWSFNEVYQNNTPTTISVTLNSVNGVAPVITGLVGVQWKKQFAKSDISILLGYEGQFWINQVQFYTLSMGRLDSLMSVQGGDLEFRYNF